MLPLVASSGSIRLRRIGGGGRIRTLEALASLATFEAARFNHSRTPPNNKKVLLRLRRIRIIRLRRMARPPWFEQGTYAFVGRHSIQLSYGRVYLLFIYIITAGSIFQGCFLRNLNFPRNSRGALNPSSAALSQYLIAKSYCSS